MNRLLLLVALLALVIVGALVVEATTTTPTKFALISGDDENHLTVNISDKPFVLSAAQKITGNALLTATFSKTQNTTGWNYYSVSSVADAISNKTSAGNATLVYYATGYLEGYIFAQPIVDAFVNTFSMPNPPAINDFIAENQRFIRGLCDINAADPSKLPKNVTKRFVDHMCLFVAQMDGITRGILAAPEKPWQFEAIKKNPKQPYFLPPGGWNANTAWTSQLMGEIMDLFTAVNFTFGDAQEQQQQEQQQSEAAAHPWHELVAPGFGKQQHCSALIRFTGERLFASHDTWATFSMMVRSWKSISLFGTTVAYSATPGVIPSLDDWYRRTDAVADMVVMETTMTPVKEIIQRFTTPYTVPYFLRVSVATFATTGTGADWSNLFLELNSCTYSCSWMIVDHHKTIVDSKTGKMTLEDNCLTIVDQLGPVDSGKWASVVEDFTDRLRAKPGYVPSFNLCMTKKCAEVTGVAAQVAKYGSFFSPTECPRAKIFAHDAPTITDLDGMKRVMRRNRWLEKTKEAEELQIIPDCKGCDPSTSPLNAIACRGDLVPSKVTSWGNLSQHNQNFFNVPSEVATDCKISSGLPAVEINKHTFCSNATIQFGPTTDDGRLPPVIMSKLPAGVQGQTWGIPLDMTMIFPWQTLDNCDADGPAWVFKKDDSSSSKKADMWNTSTAIGVGLAAALVLALVVVGVQHHFRGKKSAEEEAGKKVQGADAGAVPTEESTLMQHQV